MTVEVSPNEAVAEGCTASFNEVSFSDTYSDLTASGKYLSIRYHEPVGWHIASIEYYYDYTQTGSHGQSESGSSQGEVFNVGRWSSPIDAKSEFYPNGIAFQILGGGVRNGRGFLTNVTAIENLSTEDFIRYTINNTKVVVKFVRDEREYVDISTSASPIGAGTTTGDGRYAKGSSVTISATPSRSSDYRFIRWEDESGNKITQNPYTFIANSNKTFTAYFSNACLKFVFKDIQGASVGGIRINVDGTSYSAATDAEGIAKLYDVPDGDQWTFVISNYAGFTSVINGSHPLAYAVSDRVGQVGCVKRRSDGKFIIWRTWFNLQKPDVITIVFTKTFYIGASKKALGGVGHYDPDCDFRFADAFGHIDIYQLSISADGYSGEYRHEESIASLGYCECGGQFAAAARNPYYRGIDIPSYAHGGFKISVKQEALDRYFALGYKPMLQISKNTIYGHLEDKKIELTVGEHVFWTCYDNTVSADRDSNFAYDYHDYPLQDGHLFAYVDLVPIGIIYDPTTNKIMHESDEGKILCYA